MTYTPLLRQLVSHDDALALEMEHSFESIELRGLVESCTRRMLDFYFERQAAARARMCTPIAQVTDLGLYEAMGVKQP
jgi:hypothetical protein